MKVYYPAAVAAGHGQGLYRKKMKISIAVVPSELPQINVAEGGRSEDKSR
jgi:hypothetical protein